MKRFVLLFVILLTTFGVKSAHASDLDGCGMVGGALAVYAAGTPQGRFGALVNYIAAIGGYQVGSAVCDQWSNVPGSPSPIGETIDEQIFYSMCPTGDCAAATLPFPDEPAQCLLEIHCGVVLMPSHNFSAMDFFNAAMFVEQSILLGDWLWDSHGHILQP